MLDGEVRVSACRVVIQDSHLGARRGVHPPSCRGLYLSGGTCEHVGCSVDGMDGAFTATTLGAQPAIVISAGSLLAPSTTIRGGDGDPVGAQATEGLRQSGGSSFLIDCSVTGGDGFGTPSDPLPPGSSALTITRGTCRIARSVIQDGGGVPRGPPSAGFQVVPEMVGLRDSGAPRR